MRVTWYETTARQWISELSDRIGVAGWAALAVTPALAAEVDQHGAAVRDILLLGVEGGGTVAAVVLLASYARGLVDHHSPDWSPTSWLGLRLMAVCRLAHAHDVRPLSTPALPEVN
ncbi:hypothetical protein SAMN05216553_1265 [Lentzea fradiae]|uniref:Uncharacterized protein n=1 Tax=Lentzea fradiae TaxID=200378 RepID=A0A1G8D3B2_9PSEU|nr:DUF6401 family natural product biosynthesis protein [Lentzea fradiae]SDH52268.1 hypothetical protein SAMN05216553_1265 [Lentzea fradiae]